MFLNGSECLNMLLVFVVGVIQFVSSNHTQDATDHMLAVIEIKYSVPNDSGLALPYYIAPDNGITQFLSEMVARGVKFAWYTFYSMISSTLCNLCFDEDTGTKVSNAITSLCGTVCVHVSQCLDPACRSLKPILKQYV